MLWGFTVSRAILRRRFATEAAECEALSGTFDSRSRCRWISRHEALPAFVGAIQGVKKRTHGKAATAAEALGLPISTLVDITNYITFAYGRPLHVFDADKVKGNIRARMARDGEVLAALDGKTYALTSEMTVIADDKTAEGVAGIIGGEHSGCSETTTNVFLEARISIRRARQQGRNSRDFDARSLERGVDRPSRIEPNCHADS